MRARPVVGRVAAGIDLAHVAEPRDRVGSRAGSRIADTARSSPRRATASRVAHGLRGWFDGDGVRIRRECGIEDDIGDGDGVTSGDHALWVGRTPEPSRRCGCARDLHGTHRSERATDVEQEPRRTSVERNRPVEGERPDRRAPREAEPDRGADVTDSRHRRRFHRRRRTCAPTGRRCGFSGASSSARPRSCMLPPNGSPVAGVESGSARRERSRGSRSSHRGRAAPTAGPRRGSSRW